MEAEQKNIRVRYARQVAYWSSLPFSNRIQGLLTKAAMVALDLVFPPYCVYCERVGSLLCARCLSSVAPGPERALPGVDVVWVRTTFEGAVRAAIHALKYEHQTRLASPLGGLLCQALKTTQWPVDVVTAVPLHDSRLRARGYNQSALLGQVVAQQQGWVFDARAVTRVRETASQVGLTARERRDNVTGAFVADPGTVREKRVLVIDDVLTTGATMCACADALRAAGAEAVMGAVLAGATFDLTDA